MGLFKGFILKAHCIESLKAIADGFNFLCCVIIKLLNFKDPPGLMQKILPIRNIGITLANQFLALQDKAYLFSLVMNHRLTNFVW